MRRMLGTMGPAGAARRRPGNDRVGASPASGVKAATSILGEQMAKNRSSCVCFCVWCLRRSRAAVARQAPSSPRRRCCRQLLAPFHCPEHQLFQVDEAVCYHLTLELGRPGGGGNEGVGHLHGGVPGSGPGSVGIGRGTAFTAALGRWPQWRLGRRTYGPSLLACASASMAGAGQPEAEAQEHTPFPRVDHQASADAVAA